MASGDRCTARRRGTGFALQRGMTQESLICPKCRCTDVRSSIRNGHVLQHHCRGCFHVWEISLLNEFPSERDLEAMSELRDKPRSR